MFLLRAKSIISGCEICSINFLLNQPVLQVTRKILWCSQFLFAGVKLHKNKENKFYQELNFKNVCTLKRVNSTQIDCFFYLLSWDCQNNAWDDKQLKVCRDIPTPAMINRINKKQINDKSRVDKKYVNNRANMSTWFLLFSKLPQTHIGEWVEILDKQQIPPPIELTIKFNVFNGQKLRLVVEEDWHRYGKKHQLMNFEWIKKS